MQKLILTRYCLDKMDESFQIPVEGEGFKTIDEMPISTSELILNSELLPSQKVEFLISGKMPKMADYMRIAEQVYYHVNPETKMCVPNSAYITTEKWYHEWCRDTETDLGLFEWILKNKQ